MRVNKKMRRAALRGALTDALRSGKLAVVDELSFEEPKTKDAVGVLEALDLRGRILLVLPEPEEPVERSFRNLAHVKITFSRSLSVYDLIAADRVLFTRAALDVLEVKGSGDGRGDTRRARGSAPPAATRSDAPGQSGAPGSGGCTERGAPAARTRERGDLRPGRQGG